jgi:flagellar basal-body rod protein FlgF
MDPISITVASGMRARMESLDLLANNIANAETGGYKVDREFYNLYISPDALPADGAEPSSLPVIEKNYTDFSQGTLRETGNPLDFALEGAGFFEVATPAGAAYTRAGSFRLSSGGALITADGHLVLDNQSKPIALDPGLPVSVSPSGMISQSGNAVAQLAIVNFGDPSSLQKQGNTLYRPADPKTPATPAPAELRQGKLESSNLSPAESAVRLVGVMRQFEMLQRAMHIGAEMNRKAVEEVAKVNS